MADLADPDPFAELKDVQLPHRNYLWQEVNGKMWRNFMITGGQARRSWILTMYMVSPRHARSSVPSLYSGCLGIDHTPIREIRLIQVLQENSYDDWCLRQMAAGEACLLEMFRLYDNISSCVLLTMQTFQISVPIPVANEWPFGREGVPQPDP